MNFKKYFLDLNFNLEEKKYQGKVKIFLDLKKNLNKIELDAVDLTINDVKLNDKKTKFEIKKEKLVIKDRFLKSNLIEIDFEGKLIEKLGGIYLSRYKENGKEKYIITTQFEPIDARTAFPCYDHPNFKSVFQLKLTFPKDWEAISNTLPLAEEKNNLTKKIIFKETPRMSTYLLYFGIGEFEFLEDKYKKVLLRIVTTKGKKKGGKFALEVTKKFLNYFEKLFGYPYPLEKLDLIALPDFAAGAMENWGAITFRENLLLHFEKISTQASKLIKAEVIAHELSHMWFGNLVTMKWWDDLWLNESFATYLAYKAVNEYFPEWEIMKDYLLDVVLTGMNRDVLRSTHPIKVKIKDPNETQEIFDEISYDKGGSLLRTLNLYLGEENFRKGLQNYIKKYKYGNAEAKDLWQAFSETTKVPVVKIMSNFITKPGTPIVYLRKEKGYYLEQKKFNLHEDKKEIWLLPLFLKKNKKEEKILLRKEKYKLPSEENLILNSDFKGYYLSFLPLEEFLKNIENYNEEELINLIFSYRLLTKRGDFSLENFYHSFRAIFENKKISNLKYLLSLILGYLEYDLVYLDYPQAYKELYNLSKMILREFGLSFKKDEHNQISILRRSAYINLSYYFEDKETTKVLDGELKKIIKEEIEKVNPEFKLPVLIYGVNKDDSILKKIVNYFEKTNLIEEKTKILLSLAHLKDEKQLKYYFDYLLSDKVRFNQTIYFFRGLSGNKTASSFTMKWLEKNWQKLEEKGGGKGKSDTILIYIFKAIIPYFGALIDKNQLDSFLKKHNLYQRFKITLSYLLELSDINRNFIEKNKK